jgi:hypothetical protein
MEIPTKLVEGVQVILNTQEVKIGDQEPHCMNDTLVVIET